MKLLTFGVPNVNGYIIEESSIRTAMHKKNQHLPILGGYYNHQLEVTEDNAAFQLLKLKTKNSHTLLGDIQLLSTPKGRELTRIIANGANVKFTIVCNGCLIDKNSNIFRVAFLGTCFFYMNDDIDEVIYKYEN
jgi:hypothetical protein